MRQATVQPLRALGLVESNGERFDSFRCTQQGEAFIDAAWADIRPHKRSVLDYLVMWAKALYEDVKTSSELRTALSPLEPLLVVPVNSCANDWSVVPARTLLGDAMRCNGWSHYATRQSKSNGTRNQRPLRNSIGVTFARVHCSSLPEMLLFTCWTRLKHTSAM